jgi:2-iminobutanoate/2-iminopropanoate deaminase
MRKAVMVTGAAPAGGHYSHAVVANGFVFVSGQGPVDPATGQKPDGFAEQVKQTLTNLRTILEGAGSGMSQVVKINAYLSDVTRFAEWNKVYTESFPEAPPARTTVGCQLVGIQVEVDCIAVLTDAG